MNRRSPWVQRATLVPLVALAGVLARSLHATRRVSRSRGKPPRRRARACPAAKLDALKDSLAARKTQGVPGHPQRPDRLRVVRRRPRPRPRRTTRRRWPRRSSAACRSAVAMTDGRIALDDPAAKYVPQWKDDPRKSQITIRHLGSHTSGLEDAEAGRPAARQADRLEGRLLEAARPAERPLHDLPGTRRRCCSSRATQLQYSNPGIAMLTYAVTAALQGRAAQGHPHAAARPRHAADRRAGRGVVGRLRQDVHGGRPAAGRLAGAAAATRPGPRPASAGSCSARATGTASDSSARRPSGRSPPTPACRATAAWAGGRNADGRYAKLPRDAFWGAGAGDQVLLVVPSLNLIVVRNGDTLGADEPSDREPSSSACSSRVLDACSSRSRRSRRPAAAPYPPSPVITGIDLGAEGDDRPPGQGQRQLADDLGRRRPPVHRLRRRQRVRAVACPRSSAWASPASKAARPTSRGVNLRSADGEQQGRRQGRQEGQRHADGRRRPLPAGSATPATRSSPGRTTTARPGPGPTGSSRPASAARRS